METLLKKANNNSMTNSHIRKIGNQLKNNIEVPESVIEELEIYRLSFKTALSETYNILDNICSNYKDSIVTYRIKRFESIIKKLQRFPAMKLDRMGDIGGCRCILKNKKDVYSVYNQICTKFDVTTIKDYYETPQSDGYKSIHIYIKDTSSQKRIEIQLRNTESHDWATLVEISDYLFSESIKTKNPIKKELQEFHRILSTPNNLKYNDKIKIIRIAEEMKYIEKLIANYQNNYIPTRAQWEKQAQDSSKSYILITNYPTENKPPNINLFSSFEDAENSYFSQYSSFHLYNSVLTHIENPTYSKVSKAYSNYILTYHSFINSFFSILESACTESLKQNKVKRTKKYYKLYKKYWVSCVSNSIEEFKHVNDLKELSPKRKNEWENDIRNELKKIIKMNKIDLKISNIRKQKYFSWLLKIYLDH